MPRQALARTIIRIVAETCIIVLVFAGLNFFLIQARFPNNPMSPWFMIDGAICLILSGIYAVGYRNGNFVNPRNRIRSIGFPDEYSNYPKFALVMFIAGIILLIVSFVIP